MLVTRKLEEIQERTPNESFQMDMVYECLYVFTTVAVSYFTTYIHNIYQYYYICMHSYILPYHVFDYFSMIADPHQMKAYMCPVLFFNVITRSNYFWFVVWNVFFSHINLDFDHPN